LLVLFIFSCDSPEAGNDRVKGSGAIISGGKSAAELSTKRTNAEESLSDSGNIQEDVFRKNSKIRKKGAGERKLERFRFREAIPLCDSSRFLRPDAKDTIYHFEYLDVIFEVEFYNRYPFVVRKNNKPSYVPEAEIMDQGVLDSIHHCLEMNFQYDSMESLLLDFEAPFDDGFLLDDRLLIFSSENMLLVFETDNRILAMRRPKCTEDTRDQGYTQIETCHYLKDGYSLQRIYSVLRELAEDRAMPLEFVNTDMTIKGEKANLISFKHPRNSEYFYDLEIRLDYDGGMDEFRMYETNTYYVLVATNLID